MIVVAIIVLTMTLVPFMKILTSSIVALFIGVRCPRSTYALLIQITNSGGKHLMSSDIAMLGLFRPSLKENQL